MSDCPSCELLREMIRKQVESSDEMWRRLKRAHELINQLEVKLREIQS